MFSVPPPAVVAFGQRHAPLSGPVFTFPECRRTISQPRNQLFRITSPTGPATTVATTPGDSCTGPTLGGPWTRYAQSQNRLRVPHETLGTNTPGRVLRCWRDAWDAWACLRLMVIMACLRPDPPVRIMKSADRRSEMPRSAWRMGLAAVPDLSRKEASRRCVSLMNSRQCSTTRTWCRVRRRSCSRPDATSPAVAVAV